ncbi:hypothetical protein ASF61_19890 [Duganella sp. Leaf126]|uniref:DUF72 domain-containing protein n=1 Tax=Duganella sp. Leaf126 TaxID=1736266 RepID=UPI0006F3FF5E|nr:DUF72 domain-containing protein [Duganella sp. Leaf126]KQQ45902.1 hypothetical protein ASF61_19890 [Duganella sp. Leaf126]
MHTTLRIGCAGWGIGREQADAFPGDDSHLARYARVLNAVEINSSFYKPHQAATYARWAASVPDHFRFAVKLPRSISHEQRLAGCDALLDAFAAQANTLDTKLGCILVQLPPSLRHDSRAAGQFFTALRQRFACALACEARHGSWFGDDATALLRAHGVTRVIADPPAGAPGPYVPTTELVYARLHGSPRMYYSSYGDAYLDQVAQYLAGRDAWCVFDNTASGAALPNALALQHKTA